MEVLQSMGFGANLCENAFRRASVGHFFVKKGRDLDYGKARI